MARRFVWFWLALLLGAVCLVAAAACALLDDTPNALYLLRAGLGTALCMPLWVTLRALCSRPLRPAEVRLRTRLAQVPDDAPLPGWAWLRFGVECALAGAAVCVLAACWSRPFTLNAYNAAFRLGQFAVSPGSVAGALVALSLANALALLGAAALEAHLLRRPQVDPGARQTAVAVVAYAGQSLGWLVAADLLLGGIAQITVVAGALSVGIGFGLQNLVNNFVAGVIVLFERPVREGDWVKVGATEGRVRRITVRHTEIQTAAQAQVFVPNSDLLTQHVANETRYDRRGRLEFTLKLAPETNPTEARDLLLAVTLAHPEVGHEPEPPTVLLRALTDTGLEFAVWCVVADVARRAQVQSDLLLALAAELAQHGIGRGH